MAKLQQTVAFH